MAPHMMSFTSGPEPVNILASSELITVVVIVWVTVCGLQKSMA